MLIFILFFQPVAPPPDLSNRLLSSDHKQQTTAGFTFLGIVIQYPVL